MLSKNEGVLGLLTRGRRGYRGTCTIADQMISQVNALGGPGEVRFLLNVASLDATGDGLVGQAEWEVWTSEGEQYLQGVRTLCDNAAVVCSLMLGLTHLVTIGRPITFEPSSLWVTEPLGLAMPATPS